MRKNWRTIGSLAADVIEASRRAAREAASARIAADDAGEESDRPPVPDGNGGKPRAVCERKEAGSGGIGARPSTGQQASRGHVVLSYRERMNPAVPMGTGLRSVYRPTGFPRPALRRPVLIVIEGGLHAASLAR